MPISSQRRPEFHKEQEWDYRAGIPKYQALTDVHKYKTPEFAISFKKPCRYLSKYPA